MLASREETDMKKRWWIRPMGGVWFILASCLSTGCVPAEDTNREEGAQGDEETGAASFALSESEPNNTLAQAGVKTITFGDDNFGALSAGDTVDLWRLDVPAPTYINVFLGNIPAGSNYDLALQKDGASIWTGNKAGNANEMAVKLKVLAGSYVLKVSAVSSPQANSQYLLRAAVTAVSRAKEWVAAQMPYCQATAGQYDSACKATCTRPAAASKPDWDVYRSDCSGYVSWAWGLAAPGLTTSTLPSAFSAVAVQDLAPGDILLHQSNGGNDSGHTFLFEKWVDKAARKARILEEDTCGTVAASKDAVFSTVSASTTTSYLGRSFTARRFIMP
jgi:hypothetical protein